MRFWLAVSVWIMGVGVACAGPWPRDRGAGFVALSSDGRQHQLYAEYGIGHDWTAGIEIKQDRKDKLPTITNFLHRPVWRGKAAILSAGLALERRETLAARSWPHLAGLQEMAIRGGLFWGRGFQGHWGDGWMTLEAQIERVITEDWFGAAHSLKLDATFGLKSTGRLLLMVQAQGWKRQYNPMKLRIEPAIALRLGRAHVTAAPSVEILAPRPDPRFKLGLWFEF